MEVAASSGGEEVDDLLDGPIGTMVGRLEPAVGAVFGERLVVEAAVGERSAQALVEEQEQQRNLDALGGEAVGVAGAVPLEEGMSRGVSSYNPCGFKYSFANRVRQNSSRGRQSVTQCVSSTPKNNAVGNTGLNLNSRSR